MGSFLLCAPIEYPSLAPGPAADDAQGQAHARTGASRAESPGPPPGYEASLMSLKSINCYSPGSVNKAV